jgi:hypothetical protein
MIVGFITTYAIIVYNHWCCEFESRSGRSVQYYVIKFVAHLVALFLPKLDLRIYRSIRVSNQHWSSTPSVIKECLVCLVVSSATVNNISVISWSSALLVEEPEYPEKPPTCRKSLTNFGDRMIVGFITTYAIIVYNHWCCEFESRSGRSVQYHVIKFVSDLRQVGGFSGHSGFPHKQYTWRLVQCIIY